MKFVTPREAAEIDAILHSDLFDASWYVSRHLDVAIVGMLPEYHFYFYGGLMGRPASSRFGPDSHPDIYRAAVNTRHNPLSIFLEITSKN